MVAMALSHSYFLMLKAAFERRLGQVGDAAVMLDSVVEIAAEAGYKGKFPANFPINDRKNVVQTLREIAFQARCAIWFSEGVVYLRYLPEEPTAVDTITESDIDAEKGVEVELTSTEDLVTKMVVNWHLRFATDDRAFTRFQVFDLRISQNVAHL